MSLTELFSILNGITEFTNKVAYRSFPVNQAPALPFICYLETQSNNQFADNKVNHVVRGIDIELYTETKDTASELLVETALDDNCIPWNKSETYIDSEQCYEIVYSIEV